MLINRLDNLCTLVLTGKWPSGRRYVSEAQLHPNSELGGDEMAYTRVIRKPSSTPVGLGTEGENGEFTVKLLKVRIKSNKLNSLFLSKEIISLVKSTSVCIL